jgi:hypothetical protein
MAPQGLQHHQQLSRFERYALLVDIHTLLNCLSTGVAVGYVLQVVLHLLPSKVCHSHFYVL